MKIKTGTCPHCSTAHQFAITGVLKACGLACSAFVALGLKRPEAAALGALLTLMLGEPLEVWLKARCPECGVALQLVTALG